MSDDTLLDVLIIGAGLGGVGTAAQLIESGYDNIAVIEAADSVGGVWRQHRYPNIACDTPIEGLRLISGSRARVDAANLDHPRRQKLIRHLSKLDTDHVLVDLVDARQLLDEDEGEAEEIVADSLDAVLALPVGEPGDRRRALARSSVMLALELCGTLGRPADERLTARARELGVQRD